MNQIETLKELLGAESGASWIAFMDYVKTELAHVLTRGKPRKKDIEESIIGQAGFTSWSEMIETPTAENGLGWNLAAWDSWKRAYSLIQKYPYLRYLELTASAINTVHRETKPNFPVDVAAWSFYKSGREILQADRQQNSLKAAQKTVEQVKEQLADAQIKVGQFQQEVAACKTELLANNNTITTQAEQLGQLKQRLTITEPAADELSVLTKKFQSLEQRFSKSQNELASLKNRNLWQRIMNKR